jgi:hypothetical protein
MPRQLRSYRLLPRKRRARNVQSIRRRWRWSESETPDWDRVPWMLPASPNMNGEEAANACASRNTRNGSDA